MSYNAYRNNMELLQFRHCPQCQGSGFNMDNYHTGEPIPCRFCDNTGEWFDKHLYLPVGIYWSHEILEELDSTEYNALTDTQKDGVKVLLSCGLVNLNDGKAGKVRLWNWFGAESTTVANLTALLE